MLSILPANFAHTNPQLNSATEACRVQHFCPYVQETHKHCTHRSFARLSSSNSHISATSSHISARTYKKHTGIAHRSFARLSSLNSHISATSHISAHTYKKHTNIARTGPLLDSAVQTHTAPGHQMPGGKELRKQQPPYSSASSSSSRPSSSTRPSCRSVNASCHKCRRARKRHLI